MNKERVEKRNFSLAIVLVLVAAMFSFYIDPSPTGAFNYPERAVAEINTQPSKQFYQSPEFFPTNTLQKSYTITDRFEGDGLEELTITHTLVFTLPSDEGYVTSMVANVDTTSHDNSEIFYPNGMFELCTLWEDNYAALRLPQFHKHDSIEAIIEVIEDMRPQLESMFCEETGTSPTSLSGFATAGSGACESASAPACNAPCPSIRIPGISEPVPQFCTSYRPSPFCFCPLSSGATKCKDKAEAACSTISCAKKRIKTPKCHVDLDVKCAWAKKPLEKCHCVPDLS